MSEIEPRTTRDQLLDAGIALLTKHGGATLPPTSAICRHAGFTRGALYGYFDTSEDFYVALAQRFLADVLERAFRRALPDLDDPLAVLRAFPERLSTLPGPYTAEEVRAAYLTVIDLLDRRAATRDRHREIVAGVIDRLELAVHRGQARGQLDSWFDARHVATVIAFAAVGGLLLSSTDVLTEPGDAAEGLVGLLRPRGVP